MRDAEALLFVDDDETKILELHVLREDAVRADDHVDLARLDALDDFFLFLRRTKAREEFNLYRKRREARAKRVVMLIREHGRRREYRGLFSFHHRFERRAHRNFRLAVTD